MSEQWHPQRPPLQQEAPANEPQSDDVFLRTLHRLGRSCHAATKKTLFWPVFVMILLCGFIIYQQAEISDLQYRLDYLSDSDQEGSFARRITNLEFIINAHSATIKEQQADIYYLQKKVNDLTWRIMQLEWDHPVSTPVKPKGDQNFTLPEDLRR